MNKIIRGDQVIVIAGKDKGKQGQVVRILGEKIVVEGVNIAKRHQKSNPMRGIEGGGLAHAAGLHAWVKGDELQAVFLGLQQAGHVGFDGGPFGRGDPDFWHAFLACYAVAVEVPCDACQPPGVAHVVGDQVEGAGHGKWATVF